MSLEKILQTEAMKHDQRGGTQDAEEKSSEAHPNWASGRAFELTKMEAKTQVFIEFRYPPGWLITTTPSLLPIHKISYIKLYIHTHALTPATISEQVVSFCQSANEGPLRRLLQFLQVGHVLL